RDLDASRGGGGGERRLDLRAAACGGATLEREQIRPRQRARRGAARALLQEPTCAGQVAGASCLDQRRVELARRGGQHRGDGEHGAYHSEYAFPSEARPGAPLFTSYSRPPSPTSGGGTTIHDSAESVSGSTGAARR